MPGENDEFFRRVTAGMAAGDDLAYREFYEACFDSIYRHLLVRTRGDEDLTRDLSQAVLLRVVRYVQPFSGERVFWGWLYQLCRSVHVDWIRRSHGKIQPESLALWQEQTEADEDTDEELLQYLEQSLETLKRDERELVQQAYFDALSRRTIAEQARTTPKAIESKLARVRQKLRVLIMERLKEHVLF